METKKARVEQLWGQRASRSAAAAFAGIRENLGKMCSGLGRCMYCEDSAANDIEHFWPKSTYPEKAFLWSNYLFACSHCNSNEKREEFPVDLDGAPLLIDPTTDDPFDHLLLIPETGVFEEMNPKGGESIRVFGLNNGDRPKGRKNAWVALKALIVDFADARAQGQDSKADRLRDAICEYPFSGVLFHLLAVSQLPIARDYLEQNVRDALEKHPEIKSWL